VGDGVLISCTWKNRLAKTIRETSRLPGVFVQYGLYGTETRLFAKLLLKDSEGASPPNRRLLTNTWRAHARRSLEYEIRREVIQQICNRLANATSV